MSWDIAALGGEDSNPQRLDQNQLCCQLHHLRPEIPRESPLRRAGTTLPAFGLADPDLA